MKFGIFFTFLLLIYELSYYLAIGQKINKEKSDCNKLYNFLNNDKKDYDKNCCEEFGIKCDEEGYITYITSFHR